MKGKDSEVIEVVPVLVEMVFSITVDAVNGGGGIMLFVKGIKN